MDHENNPTTTDTHGSAPGRPPRTLRILGFIAVTLLTLVALAWAVENWRGARAWASARRELVSRGEPLSIEQLVPPLPPPPENFAETPLLRELLQYHRPEKGSGQAGSWRDPRPQLRLSAIQVPPMRTPRGRSQPAPSFPQDEDVSVGGRRDLADMALGIRLMPRTCPPDLDPVLAKRYGYLPPGVKWKKPTNELEIAASISDPSQEVLDYLHRFDPELEEIAQAVQRPNSQFPLHWDENYQMLLPHLAPLKQFTLLFSFRAAARMRKGDTNGAFADTLTDFRLAHALDSEPLLISRLVAMAQHAIAVKTVWDGLDRHQWNQEQLAAFQRELNSFDFDKELVFVLRGERVFENRFLDDFKWTGAASLDALASDQTPRNLLVQVLPWVPGWIRQNQVRINRYDDGELSMARDPQWPASLVHAPDQQAVLQDAGITGNSPYVLLARYMIPDISKLQAKAARAQTVNRLALVACALERYRQEHGAYPKELSELTPRELPGSSLDPMSGAPLHYGRSSGSAMDYQLWSVGPNGQDDGGVMFEQDNDHRGDWVWPSRGLGKAHLF